MYFFRFFLKNQIKALEYINKLLSEALINILVASISGYHKKVLLHMCTRNYYSVSYQESGPSLLAFHAYLEKQNHLSRLT